MNDTMQDNGNVLLSLMAELKLGIGNLHKAVKEQNNYWQKRAGKVTQPVFYTYADQAAIATNFGVARLTGPDQGHVWYVKGIVVGFAANGVAGPAAGTADIFVSAADHRSRTALTQFNMIDWRDHFASMPTVRQYSTGQIVLRFNEELYVAFSAATTGTPYLGVVWVEDFEEGAVEQAWAL